MSDDKGGLSRSAAGPHNPWLIAGIVSIATFMQVLDTSIATVSLRHIAGGLSASYQESTWIVSSYLISTAIILPISGWLSQVIGRKAFYMLSVALFTVSSLLCGLANNLDLLILFRVLQGLGGGGLAPSEQSILADSFPPEKRNQAFSLYAVTVIVAPTIGPVLGGFITDSVGWHWVFLINVPVGILSLLLTGIFLVEPPAAKKEREELLKRGIKFDWIGFLLIAVGFGCLEIVLERGQNSGWFASPAITIMAAAAVLSLVALIPWELSRDEPIVDLRLFANRQFALSAIALLAVGTFIFSTIQILPQLLQEVMNYSATSAGLTMMPGGIASLIELPITSFLLTRLQPRLIIAFGLAVEAVALWHMTGFSADMGMSTVAWARVFQATGLSFLFVPITTAAYGNLSPKQTSQASALMNVARNLGGSLGIAFAQAMIFVGGASHGQAQRAVLDLEHPDVQTAGKAIGTELGAIADGPAGLSRQAISAITTALQPQADMLAYIDVFRTLAIVAAILAPLALLLKNVELGKGRSG